MAEEYEESSRKKQKMLSTTSSKLTTAATTILLNDANKGFKNGNFVCSPFSLEILLGMVAAGAEGETLKQLLGFLGCETIDQVLYESESLKLCKILSIPNLWVDVKLNRGVVDVSLANGVWGAKKLSAFQSGYTEILESVYETKVGLLDFENEPDEAVSEINSWVDKKTKGLIPTIVEKSDLPRDTKIIFANALYFQASWHQPFLDTREKDFHLINGEKKIVTVPFMTSYSGFDYGSFEDYKILKLPYESGSQGNKLFSMYIFLPDRKDGLQDLLQMFHSDHALFRTRFDLEQQFLEELWIPKFKISYTFEAHEVMTQMGLTLPFEPTNMELTRIIESRCRDEDMLYVSKILLKSFIEIDEKGTKAAACCLSRLTGGGGGPPPRYGTFVADHPFMFMIREDISKAVFFIGVVLNPLA